MSRIVRIGAGVAAVVAVAAPAQAAAPKVDQLVAFRDGSAKQSRVAASSTTARVGGRTCAVGQSTPLAALLRSKPGAITLRDYGVCSRRAADAGGLYVAKIGPDRARGTNGWVYKVGNKVATAGAADPTGPFGRGRLKSGARVTWFYCRMSSKTGSCQRTLGIKTEALGGGMLKVTVRSYDDRGRSKPAVGATAVAGDAVAKTDASGVATLTLPPGTARVHAESSGAVRSFEEAVSVR
ncbi:MAG: hypothetical protein QOC95_1988 [Thermoleophilaceae bacterium]|nr:hypothetical protein [Thermoleophilaceae bacterium]